MNRFLIQILCIWFCQVFSRKLCFSSWTYSTLHMEVLTSAKGSKVGNFIKTGEHFPSCGRQRAQEQSYEICASKLSHALYRSHDRVLTHNIPLEKLGPRYWKLLWPYKGDTQQAQQVHTFLIRAQCSGTHEGRWSCSPDIMFLPQGP